MSNTSETERKAERKKVTGGPYRCVRMKRELAHKLLDDYDCVSKK